MKGDDVFYKEWTSRRPWKERKKAIKEREKGSLQLISHNQDPDMIYYGRHSGVVGLSKSELFQNSSVHDISLYGYDKVWFSLSLVFSKLFCWLELNFDFKTRKIRYLWMQSAHMMVQLNTSESLKIGDGQL